MRKRTGLLLLGLALLVAGWARIPRTDEPTTGPAAPDHAAAVRPAPAGRAPAGIPEPGAPAAPEGVIPPEDPRAVAPEGVVRGRVLTRDGRPVEGATVWLVPAHVTICFTDGYDRPAHYQYIRYTADRTATDRYGRYEFREVPMGGRYAVIGEAPGRTRDRRDVFVAARSPTAVPDLRLPPAASLTVRVLGPDGEALDSARMAVAPGRVLLLSGIVRRPGVFRFDGLTGEPHEVWVLHEPYRARSVAVDLSPGESREVIVRMEEGGETLEGTVTDDRGEPVAGARLHVCYDPLGWMVSGSLSFASPDAIPPPDGPSEAHAASDPEGRFRLAGLRAGAHEFHVTADGHVPFSDSDAAVPARDLSIRLDRTATATVDLRVPPGLPRGSEARVTIEADRTYYASAVATRTVPIRAGPVTVSGVPPGRHRLKIEAEGCAPATTAWAEFAPGETRDLGVIMLSPPAAVPPEPPVPTPARLRGRVIGADGRPVPETQVGIFAREADGGLRWIGDCYADHRGVFTRELPPGSWRLGIRRDAATGPDVELRAGEETWLVLRR